MSEDLERHVVKRESELGRWAPVAFYVLNAILWFVTGVVCSAIAGKTVS